MKRLSYIIMLCSAFMACKNKDSFTISGTFKNVDLKGKVYLYGLRQNSNTPVDSTVLSEKGEFKFEHESPEADFFRVAAGDNEYLLIAKNGDDIEIEADLADPSLTYNVSGAREAEKLHELNKTKNEYVIKINRIQQQFDKNVEAQPDKRDMIMEQMRPAYMAEVEAMNKAVLKFAQENSESLAGFFAINMLNPAEYEREMVAYADDIKDRFKGNQVVSDFVSKMAGLKKVQVGQQAPDFTLPALKGGQQIKLSDFKGKYLLIDFWASWCMPCREENPNVVKAYNKYKDKNFTILGISLDKDAIAWKKAIEDDGLTWTHGGELKDFEGPVVRMYQINSIPSSFLLDPNGKIIAKNLKGAELEAFLSKTL
ncbi:redoxin domain-containing protein [Pedobacter faecalis]|uniref:redoxin domain-containing protein n=1 Tax=Pedobacter faecalis TaxID=3041495 RepID=UPI00254CDDFA|nr:redoxin domain-containing protein [Pedobacter sp. ELA7]